MKGAMRYYTPSVKIELVRAVVQTWGKAGIGPAMVALTADLARVDAEEAKFQDEENREVLRKRPALTTQKVLGILRKAKLDISRAETRGDAGDGLSVSYGDYDRTWIKVSYYFAWNFGYVHNLTDKANHPAKVKLVETELLTSARVALVGANLQVSAHNDPNDNPYLTYLKVQP